ncbi:cytochrome c [Rhodanobacter sp. Si-c]|uniref:Cytochrome c n=1 Tax=Rhodanobacter lycopersici TaxID=3162487 RepID=A0ABV3QFZ0_9GAMM
MNTLSRTLLGVLVACVGTAAGGTSNAADQAGPILDAGQLAQASGQQIFEHICQACHMSDARGASGAARFPALAGDARLASADYVIVMVLNGRSDMPSFGPRPDYRGLEAYAHTDLDDAAIARVVNYVRSHFGNHYRDTVTAAQVAALHPAHKGSP